MIAAAEVSKFATARNSFEGPSDGSLRWLSPKVLRIGHAWRFAGFHLNPGETWTTVSWCLHTKIWA